VCVTMSDDPIKDNHVIVIGKPIANVHIYILDSTGNLCDVEVPGEIVVGGVQVARGYLNRPELTAEKFIPNPFVKDKNAKMYKTGDLGRWLPDGNIEFLGRIDEQVKIRGYRIELGEIENVLQQCELVRQAVVVARKDKEGDKRLVAYIIPEKSFDRNAVITFLRGSLPEYMVPAIFVKLESFPITPNGKIDKKALPEPDMNDLSTDEYVSPSTEMEKAFADIWQKALHIDRVGINDNFFELGGNSIISIEILNKARHLGYNLQPNDLFNYQNIENLCSALAERAEKGVLQVTNGYGKCLIPIQTNGKYAPFFTIHDPWIYTKLAYHLSKDQPFYCLDGSSFTKVEEIASQYIKEIKTVQPNGPYYIGGYCDHGTIALEVAHQLEAAGEKVAALILFESYFSGTAKRLHYEIKKYPGNVILFRGSKRKFWKKDDPLMGWSDYFTGEVETYAVKGRELDIFKEPGITKLAENIESSLEKIRSKYS